MRACDASRLALAAPALAVARQVGLCFTRRPLANTTVRSLRRTALVSGFIPASSVLQSPRLICSNLRAFQSKMPPNGERVTCTVAVQDRTSDTLEEETDAPVEIFLRDYKPPSHSFETVDLTFLLGEDHTVVKSVIRVKPMDQSGNDAWSIAGQGLRLDGENLKLLLISINGKELSESEYRQSKRAMTILNPPQELFELEIITQIEPQSNTSLEGLYKSSGNFCTQCEAQGFRKITYFQDRPDVMAKFTTRIEGDKNLYPVLLSNGNLVDQGQMENGKHFALWEDPFKKPCYLFALVAGNLSHLEDTFQTKSGRPVILRIYVNEIDLHKCDHAMRSLKASMKWDEEVFGLEYDLDLFNIVAVPDFNMGAMENKSLNVRSLTDVLLSRDSAETVPWQIFNSRLVLATPETATDADYSAIEGVIAHEYFHNWTGNRVTCRDWFQLSLKEGLTVFRDQVFSADMNSRAVKRISDVMCLRSSQFSEDAGPMAHPVRPESYIKMDNFYTHTVYEKGAEVVRMYQTLLEKEGFRKGMDLYFQRHDGQAVTCDDFLAAMRDANIADLSIFSRWYSQAGTPSLSVATSYDSEAHTFTLHCKQEVPATPGQNEKQHMLLPLAVGLVGPDGSDLPLKIQKDGHHDSSSGQNGKAPTTLVLRVEQDQQVFTFEDVVEQPVPSLLRGFSAPVRLETDLTDEQLTFLLAHDSDEFNRWEAGQSMARKLMLALVEQHQHGESISVPASFIQAFRSLASDPSLDKAFLARAMSLPGESELADYMNVADPDAIHEVHTYVRRQLAGQLRTELLHLVEANRSTEAYQPTHQQKARRGLKNAALGYLTCLNEPETTSLAVAEFQGATNMTDQFAALACLNQNAGDARDAALSQFYEQWKSDNLVMNKWLGLQASASIPGNVANVQALLHHPAFNIKEPNKVYSLIGGFCACPSNFYAKDGTGFAFLGDMVLELDKLNAQVAARMVSAFTRWRKYDVQRQEAAQAQLQRIISTNGLSENVYEIVFKSLAS
eukprot:SM000140S00617  [mRNA]  locus=s140:328743:335330:+ [translate_table: standard]